MEHAAPNDHVLRILTKAFARMSKMTSHSMDRILTSVGTRVKAAPQFREAFPEIMRELSDRWKRYNELAQRPDVADAHAKLMSVKARLKTAQRAVLRTATFDAAGHLVAMRPPTVAPMPESLLGAEEKGFANYLFPDEDGSTHTTLIHRDTPLPLRENPDVRTEFLERIEKWESATRDVLNLITSYLGALKQAEPGRKSDRSTRVEEKGPNEKLAFIWSEFVGTPAELNFFTKRNGPEIKFIAFDLYELYRTVFGRRPATSKSGDSPAARFAAEVLREMNVSGPRGEPYSATQVTEIWSRHYKPSRRKPRVQPGVKSRPENSRLPPGKTSKIAAYGGKQSPGSHFASVPKHATAGNRSKAGAADE